MPSGQSGDRSRGEAIVKTAVVGWNETQQRALLWLKPTTTWLVKDLNITAVIGGCNLVWDIFQAHDLNEDGWIVGWGDPDGSNNDKHALLLVPYGACPYDVNRDGVVNSTDVAIVHASYGACPTGEICWNDVNGDCLVNGRDETAVVLAIGTCGAEGASGGGSGFASIEAEDSSFLVSELPLPEDLIELWLDSGGQTAVESGVVSAGDIIAALQLPSEADRIAALFALLGQ